MRALVLALLLAGCATVAPVPPPPPPAPKVIVEKPVIVAPAAPLRYQTEPKKCKPVCQQWKGQTLCDDVCR